MELENKIALAPVTTPQTGRRAADRLVEMLVEHGVEVIFGLPGGPISPLHDALLGRAEIRVITTRHESGALFAAAGYARVTGKLGVAMVTSGPGALNALSGLGSAFCDGMPVLLLVGEVARKSYGKGALQDGSPYGLQLIEILRRLTKSAAEVHDAQRAPALLQAAIFAAQTAPRGPVALTLPIDVMLEEIDEPMITRVLPPEPSISMSAVAETRRALRESTRVVLFAGSGARHGRGPVLLRALAERMQCPVMTTPKGKGVFPEDHPLSLGVYGMAGHLSAREYIYDGVDTLMALGTSLGELATEGWTPLLRPERALVHVDVDERQLGRAYPCTVGIVASVEQFCERMLAELPAAAPRNLGGIRRHLLPDSTHDLIAPQRAILEIQEALPVDTIFTIDSGEHFMFATHYLETLAPDSFVAMTGLGSMGQSIGAAIGAQLAQPHRVVAAICGDGCFAMNAFEIATAVAGRIPIIVFVINDQRLGMVELGHQAVYGRRPSYPTTPMEVASIGRALGAQALTVNRAGQIVQTDLMRLREKGPVVIDVRIDPAIKMPKKDRLSAFTTARAPKRVAN